MIAPLRHLLGWIVSAFGSREGLILENLALRQQLLALRAKRPRRRLTALHKLFWVVLRRLWSGWKRPLILVTPRTVIGWHRAGFRLYWKWLSRAKQMGGRKPVTKEVRALIFRMAAENPTWGAPRIHGELLKLGSDISEPTVSRWLRRAPRNLDPAQRWLTFDAQEFSSLTALRAEILSRLLPCTPIADRCKIKKTYLEVRGQLGTYRIPVGWSGAALVTDSGMRWLRIPSTARRKAQCDDAQLWGSDPKSRMEVRCDAATVNRAATRLPL